MVHNNRHLIITLLIIICSTASVLAQNSIKIHGTVKDTDGEGVPYVTVRLKDTSWGCATDLEGHFSFTAPVAGQTLLISAIGYDEWEQKISEATHFPLRITLKSATYALGEVEIKPKRERYKRRENPAVELAKYIISNKEKESPYANDFFSKRRYERVVVALDNYSSDKKGTFFFKSFDFLDEYVDTSTVTGNPILNISSRELVATDYFQRSPWTEKQLVHAKEWAGIEDFVPEDQVEIVEEATITDVDLFSDQIHLFGKDFSNPLSEAAAFALYRYFILDTLMIDGDSCVDLAFTPSNTQSFGFTGHFYVTTDSAHFIKQINMTLPYDDVVNFVKFVNIEQRFIRTPEHPRLMAYESITTLLNIYDFMDGLFCKREVSYSDFKFNEEVEKEIFSKSENVIIEEQALEQDSQFWAEFRDSTSTSNSPTQVKDMVSRLRSNKFYYITERLVEYCSSGLVPIKPKNSPLVLGPIYTVLTTNELEGARIRLGGLTTGDFSKNLFGQFILVYGTKDQRFNYMGQLEYSFLDKLKYPTEFPTHSIGLKYENDIFQYGQTYRYFRMDNIIFNIKRRPDNLIGYRRLAELTYSRDFYNGLSYKFVLRNSQFESSPLVKFERTLENGDILQRNTIQQSELEINLSFAPHAEYIQKRWDRVSLTPQHPVFELSHSISYKNLLGSDYTIQKTSVSYRQRYHIAPFGYINTYVNANKIWNKVPYPLMIMPNANISYIVRRESFELMNPMEFMFDSNVLVDLNWFLGGNILGRIPLLNKLKLREVAIFRGIWGTTQEYNDPRISTDADILDFPENAIVTPMKEPYMEFGVGVENIFQFFRVDYYRRITYRNTPGTDTEGVRFSVHLQF